MNIPPCQDPGYELALHAEVRRLINELRCSGPMRRDTLARRCHCEHWRNGSLEGAVRAGVRRGALRQLPFGYVDVVREPRTGAPHDAAA